MNLLPLEDKILAEEVVDCLESCLPAPAPACLTPDPLPDRPLNDEAEEGLTTDTPPDAPPARRFTCDSTRTYSE